MTTVREQVHAALSHCAKAYRDADAISTLAALDAELAGMETTAENRASLMPRMRRSLMAMAAFVRGTIDMEPRMHEALDALDDVERLLRDVDRLLLERDG